MKIPQKYEISLDLMVYVMRKKNKLFDISSWLAPGDYIFIKFLLNFKILNHYAIFLY